MTPAAAIFGIEDPGISIQGPRRRDGEFAGLAEFSLELPAEMPYFKRKP